MTCAPAPVGCGATNVTVTVRVDLGKGVVFDLCRRCWTDSTTRVLVRTDKRRSK